MKRLRTDGDVELLEVVLGLGEGFSALHLVAMVLGEVGTDNGRVEAHVLVQDESLGLPAEHTHDTHESMS
jgi:hypothetical protein